MRKTLTIACALVVVSVAGTLASVKLVFAGDQLTIVSWGGASQVATRKAFFEPFTKATGVKITEDEWNGEVSKVRAMVESKNVSWDVIDVGASTHAMCAGGLIETIDWRRLGLDRSKFMGGDKNDCGLPHDTSATVIAYDKDRLPNGPKTIADVFDTKKFPGKRGLQKSPFGNLEWALIADGVAIKDVYKVLNTPDGVDRAFKKLETIKKDVIWWTAGAQAPQLLADGQVVITAAWQSTIRDAVKNSGKKFEIMWDAALLSLDFWVITKGSPHLDDAYKFLAFAGAPQPQADLTRYLPYGPANKDAMALVDPAILPELATSPDHLANALEYDYAFWSDKRDDLRQRFTAWLAK